MHAQGHAQLAAIPPDHVDVLDPEVVCIGQLVKVMNFVAVQICVVINVMDHVELVLVRFRAVQLTTQQQIPVVLLRLWNVQNITQIHAVVLVGHQVKHAGW